MGLFDEEPTEETVTAKTCTACSRPAPYVVWDTSLCGACVDGIDADPAYDALVASLEKTPVRDAGPVYERLRGLVSAWAVRKTASAGVA